MSFQKKIWQTSCLETRCCNQLTDNFYEYSFQDKDLALKSWILKVSRKIKHASVHPSAKSHIPAIQICYKYFNISFIILFYQAGVFIFTVFTFHEYSSWRQEYSVWARNCIKLCEGNLQILMYFKLRELTKQERSLTSSLLPLQQISNTFPLGPWWHWWGAK